MRRWPAVLGVVVTVLSGCSLLGFYDEAPTQCPEDPACCSKGDPLANGGCDWTCNDPAAPDFRLTAMRLTPGAPVSTLFRSALEGSVTDGGLVWLVDMSTAGGATTFRTGAGICEQAESCRFDDGFPPASGAATLGHDGRLSLPTAGTFDTTVSIDAADLGARFELRLHECTLSGAVESDANCIGRRTSPSPGDWSTPARLACKVSANEATDVDLTGLNLTLCDLLAACGSLSCCDEAPGNWINAPDTTVGGFPAWSLQADVAAIGVRISE